MLQVLMQGLGQAAYVFITRYHFRSQYLYHERAR